jgi:hypothetical protein
MTKGTEEWALSEMKNWLSDPLEFGKEPEELEVVYSKLVYWYGKKEKVFLIRYKYENKKEFMGITGPFTWSFIGISLDVLNCFSKPERMNRLINAYFGWVYCFDLFNSEQYKELEIKALNREGFESAFKKDMDNKQINLLADMAVENVELLGNTSCTSLKGKYCELICESDPDFFYHNSTFYYTAKATIKYDLQGLEGHKGIVTTKGIIYVTANEKNKLNYKTLSYRPFIENSLECIIPLYHFVGTYMGPFLYRVSKNLTCKS